MLFYKLKKISNDETLFLIHFERTYDFTYKAMLSFTSFRKLK